MRLNNQEKMTSGRACRILQPHATLLELPLLSILQDNEKHNSDYHPPQLSIFQSQDYCDFQRLRSVEFPSLSSILAVSWEAGVSVLVFPASNDATSSRDLLIAVTALSRIPDS